MTRRFNDGNVYTDLTEDDIIHPFEHLPLNELTVFHFNIDDETIETSNVIEYITKKGEIVSLIKMRDVPPRKYERRSLSMI